MPESQETRTHDRDTILHLGHIQRNSKFRKTQPHLNLLRKNVLLGTAVDVPGVNVGGFGVSFLVALTGLRFLILSKTSLYN